MPRVRRPAGRAAAQLLLAAPEQLLQTNVVFTCISELCSSPAGALATARRQRKQAPVDADAAGLLALLLLAQPAQRSTAQQLSQQASQGLDDGGQQQPAPLSPETAAEVASCLVQLLAADPSSHTAAAGLLALHGQQPIPSALLVEGCCYYVEGQPPSWLPPLLELRGAGGRGWAREGLLRTNPWLHSSRPAALLMPQSGSTLRRPWSMRQLWWCSISSS